MVSDLTANGPPVTLETRDLGRRVGDIDLVVGVNLQVRRGDVLAVVGPSGAGKSSFLRLLNRLDEPTAGTVFLEGQDYREIPPRELRRRVGMVMQQAYLFPGTVAENLRFGPQQRGESLSDDRLAQLLSRVGLEGYQARNVSRLSGGEAQRVSLARTLANRPEVLLLDEPTSSLDDASEQDVEDLIRQILSDGNLTCLIVTHDMDQAARLARSAALFEDGRLIKVGPVGEVLHA